MQSALYGFSVNGNKAESKSHNTWEFNLKYKVVYKDSVDFFGLLPCIKDT